MTVLFFVAMQVKEWLQFQESDGGAMTDASLQKVPKKACCGQCMILVTCEASCKQHACTAVIVHTARLTGE